METFISDLSRKEFPLQDKIAGKAVRKPILKIICDEHPAFDPEGCLSTTELNYYRQKYIADFFAKEIDEMSELEETVLTALETNKSLVGKIEPAEEKITFGQRLADGVASFGGSWNFIVLFMLFMLAWIAINVYMLTNQGFDPYPFTLLNLILSCLAALQAPVIMMSQNRQEDKDRLRAKNDYMINLKSELEIRLLHEKIDHLMMHQQHDLIEIQKVQVEMMDDILKRVKQS
jgi:uncharacterized membrane protein